MDSLRQSLSIKATAKLAFTLVVLPALLLVAMRFCSNWVEHYTPDEASVSQNQLYQPFWLGRQGFRGLHGDRNAATESFAFSTALSHQAYFEAVDRAAKSQGWQLITAEGLERTYGYEYKVFYYKMTLTYNPANSEVTLKLESFLKPSA